MYVQQLRRRQMEREQRSFIMTLYVEVFHTCVRIYVCVCVLAAATATAAVQWSYLGCFSCVSRLDVCIYKTGIANGKWHASTYARSKTHTNIQADAHLRPIYVLSLECYTDTLGICTICICICYSIHAGIFWISIQRLYTRMMCDFGVSVWASLCAC